MVGLLDPKPSNFPSRVSMLGVVYMGHGVIRPVALLYLGRKSVFGLGVELIPVTTVSKYRLHLYPFLDEV